MTNEIIANWQNKPIQMNEGISLNALKMLEDGLNFTFPTDFKTFYQKINGFKDNDWTESMLTLYPIELIKEYYLSSPYAPHFIGIADQLIGSFNYGFSKNKAGIFKVGWSRNFDAEITYLCASFTEFIDLVDKDAIALYK